MRKTLALVFSLFGLFDSAYLWWVYTSPTHPLVCLGTGCDEVRASRFAFWGGIPTPAFGVAMYGALVALLLVEPFLAQHSSGLLRKLAFGISAVGVVISLYLTSLEAFAIHAWCAWCVAQQIAIAIVFVLLAIEIGKPAPEDPALTHRGAVQNTVVFVVALVIAVPAFAWLSHHSAAEVKKQLDANSTEGPPDLSRLIRSDSHAIGPADAPVTVVEFGDFQCPSCVIAEATNQEIRRRFPKQVRFVFHQFPLAKFHQFAQKAAEAAECADDQGKFWQMHDRMYQAYGELAVVQLKYYAQDIGLDTAKFNSCLDSGAKAQRVQQDVDDGKAVQVTATPTFYINQQKHVGGLVMQEFAATVNAAQTAPATEAKPTPKAQPKPVQPAKPQPKPVASEPTSPSKTAAAASASSIVPGLAPVAASPLAMGQADSGDCDVNGTQKPQKNEIPTTVAQDFLKKGAVFVDIRQPKDFAKSHIQGAVNLPLNKISDGASTLPKDKPVVVYESGLASGDVCAASRAAAGLLASRGFKEVKVYHDGFAGWQKAGGAVQ
jgi:protein-disulfide isomerase/rhodanese-related sulfurtransferase